jgi:hypothetical protein
MIPRFYTEAAVAKCLHRERRWLLEWLREHPTDVHGRPFYAILGRSKRFTGDDVMRLLDAILTLEEGPKVRDEEGSVYFIDGGEHIKIGFTRSLASRLKKMGTDVPGGPKILLIQPGSFKTEKVVHRQFAADRVRGEWFRKSPTLLAFIAERRGLA